MFFVHSLLQHTFAIVKVQLLLDGRELSFLFKCRLTIVLLEGLTGQEDLSRCLSLGRLIIVVGSALLGQLVGELSRERIEACRPARLDIVVWEVRRPFISDIGLDVFSTCVLCR